MTDLTLVPNSPQWHAMRKRAKEDLFFLADAILGYGEVVPLTLRAHYLMCRFAERRTGNVLLDDAHVRLVLVPRGVGKSTVITQAHAIQWVLQDPGTAILIANETERGATKFLGEIKHHFESNDLLRALFPELIPPDFRSVKWSESEATIVRPSSRKEATFMAVGEGAAITGLHPDKIILDDLISDEAMENARAGVWSLMDKANRWIDRLRPIVNLGSPFWEIVVVGTHWWENDIYTHVEEAFGYGQPPRRVTLACQVEDGETQSLTPYRTGDIAVFKRGILESGKSYFPEKWSDEDCAKLRVADPVLFAANLMNDPRAPEVTLFKPGWRRYFTWANPEVVSFTDATGKMRHERVADLDRILSIDPAFTEGGTSDSRQALLVTGGTDDGLRMILAAEATKQNVEAFAQRIVTACERFRPRKVLIEKAGQQLAFVLDIKKRLHDRRIATVVEEVQPGGKNKDVRIATLEAWFQRGLVYGEQNQTEFWQEYDAFPRGKYKDLLDALAYQVAHWKVLAPDQEGTVNGEQRAQEEVRRLMQRMGRAPMAPSTGGRYRADGSRRW